jgi:hypothetical protein
MAEYNTACAVDLSLLYEDVCPSKIIQPTKADINLSERIKECIKSHRRQLLRGEAVIVDLSWMREDDDVDFSMHITHLRKLEWNTEVGHYNPDDCVTNVPCIYITLPKLLRHPRHD